MNEQDQKKTNFDRWKSSAEPESWVRKHIHGWSHDEWLELLASLHKQQYWPMDEAAIGQHIEMLRAKLKPTVMPNIQCPMGELVIRFAFLTNEMKFDSVFSGKVMFSYGAPTPSSALLAGRGIKLKFPSVQEQISQKGVNMLGGIGIKLQEELPSHFANLDWERIKKEADYGLSVRDFIIAAFVQWIRDNILTPNPIVSISFFSI